MKPLIEVWSFVLLLDCSDERKLILETYASAPLKMKIWIFFTFTSSQIYVSLMTWEAFYNKVEQY